MFELEVSMPESNRESQVATCYKQVWDRCDI